MWGGGGRHLINTTEATLGPRWCRLDAGNHVTVEAASASADARGANTVRLILKPLSPTEKAARNSVTNIIIHIIYNLHR